MLKRSRGFNVRAWLAGSAGLLAGCDLDQFDRIETEAGLIGASTSLSASRSRWWWSSCGSRPGGRAGGELLVVASQAGLVVDSEAPCDPAQVSGLAADRSVELPGGGRLVSVVREPYADDRTRRPEIRQAGRLRPLAWLAR
jgi:hypothetical protein